MEAASAARKARLEALRSNKASSSNSSLHPFRRAFLTHLTPRAQPPLTPLDGDEGDDPAGVNAAGASSSVMRQTQAVVDSAPETALLRKFRNWDPMTGEVRQGNWDTVTGIEDEMKGVQEAVLREDEEARRRDLDLLNIAPRKPNWDLRRDLNKRLKKLERRDREARLILIRQRLKAAAAAAGSDGANADAKEEALKRQADLIAMSTVAGSGVKGRRGVGEMGDGAEESSQSEGEGDD